MPPSPPVSASGPLYTLHIISDATGNLAAHMINSVLTQFPETRFRQHFHVFKNRKDDLPKVVEQIKTRNHIVFYALLDAASKEEIHRACVRKRVPHYDLTGSLVQFLSDHIGVLPANELSRLHQTDAGYFRRIEAMEFTAQHDDGRGLHTLSHADIIIVGLSRVSKSPTSTYLSAMGYKVANISISKQTGFPDELNKRLGKKCIAFTLQPRRLADIRRKRLAETEALIAEHNIQNLDYADLRTVIREVMYAEQEYKKRAYPILDITDLTVEEIAATVLKTLGTRNRNLAYD